jgi:hypothetical protein
MRASGPSPPSIASAATWLVPPASEVAADPAPGLLRPEAQVAELAALQHGLVTWSQLLACHVTKDRRTALLRRGLLVRVAPEVYAVGHGALSAAATIWAAVLSYGDQAVLAAPSSVLAHGLLAPWQVPEVVVPVHVAVPPDVARRVRPGTVLHRWRLPEEDVVQLGALRTASVERSLVDLGASATVREVERAVDQGIVDGRTSPAALAAAAQRSAGRPGVAVLRHVLARAEHYGSLTRSQLEEQLRRLARGSGHPVPRCNAAVQGVTGRLDAWWPKQRVAVEADGWGWHRTGRRQHADRRKELDCRRAGITLLRYSARMLFEEQLLVAADLATALRRRT